MPEMNKSERADLKTLVRRRFTQLRKDVDVRVKEIVAEAAVDRVQPDSAEAVARQEFELYVARRIQDARSDIAKAFEEMMGPFPLSKLRSGGLDETGKPEQLVGGRTPQWDQQHEHQVMMAAQQSAIAKGEAAKADLERQEVDMLEKLTLDGLETEAAKEFLASIPTVGELIPTSMMPQLEG